MKNIFEFFGSKEKQEPIQEKDINEIRSELKEKLDEREDLLKLRVSSFGSPEDMAKDEKVKKLDEEIKKLREDVLEKESVHKIAS